MPASTRGKLWETKLATTSGIARNGAMYENLALHHECVHVSRGGLASISITSYFYHASWTIRAH